LVSGTSEPVLYVVAECPVDSGGVVALKAALTGKIIFAAPCCGIAWREPPLSGLLDEVTAIVDVEPGPMIPATLAELTKAGLEKKILRTEPVEDFPGLEDVPGFPL